MKQIDCRNWQCPQPVIEVRKQMLANPTLILEVLLADEIAQENIRRLAQTNNYAVEEKVGEKFIRMILTPGRLQETEQQSSASSGPIILVCASDKMGDGDAELGTLLLKNFLITLLETTEVPDTIYFVNTGVKLACGEAETTEILEKLACRGIDIASCGLCLEYYKVKEELRVGRITNMLEIVEAQLNAGRIIRP